LRAAETAACEEEPVKTVLVTGGAGFIGSHLCERLIGRGDCVVCYDSFDPYYEPWRKEQNLAAIRRDPCFNLVRGDIRDAEQLDKVMTHFAVSHVVHLAARAGVRPSLEEPALYQQVNVCGTTNVLEAARRVGIGQVVMASSSSVYGANTKTPFHEDDPVLQPISPYAASKRATELIAFTYSHLYGMDVLCHRFFTVYGPRQRPDMAISKFVHRVLRGEPIEMYGDGTTRRDYTFIEDIVDGLVASVDRARGLGFQIFNLGNSQTVMLGELIAAIGRAAGCVPDIRPRPEQPGDVKITYASIEKAARLLDYRPATGIEEGIAHYVSWLRANSGPIVSTARPRRALLPEIAPAQEPLLRAA
jgi:UDP-glucuronate 4-epimerase